MAAAGALPAGAGVVFRGFGREGSEALARKLSRLARRRRLVLLIGADAAMARRVGAHGVHLPERQLPRARGLRLAHPNWLITGAVHSARAAAQSRALPLDAAFLSPAFQSQSPSAGAPLGPVRLALLIRRSGRPVHALGGVDALTAGRLIGTGARGFAAVGALSGVPRPPVAAEDPCGAPPQPVNQNWNLVSR